MMNYFGLNESEDSNNDPRHYATCVLFIDFWLLCEGIRWHPGSGVIEVAENF